MSIPENLKNIRTGLPENVTLVAVSKFHPVESLQEAYKAGQRVFGESKVQELCSKYEILPKDVKWHFIGHLQTNKIKFIVPFVELIHAVDSKNLLSEINKLAAKVQRKVNCLLQVHIAEEETKFGFSETEILDFFKDFKADEYPFVQICGLMGMATFSDNSAQVRAEFKTLKNIFDKIKSEYFNLDENFKEISMGMSDDYPIAVDEGSTMVRIGSSIFGNRVY